MNLEESYKALRSNREDVEKATVHNLVMLSDFLAWKKIGESFCATLNGFDLTLCKTPNSARVISDDAKVNITSPELLPLYNYLDKKFA